MNKTLIVIVILVIVGIGAYYILNNGFRNTLIYTNPPTSDTNIPALSTQPPITPTKARTTPLSTTPKSTTVSNTTISIKNFAFNPKIETIKIGTNVTWINNDIVAHTVTSDSSNLLNSAIISPGQSFSFTLTDTGNINYHCSIHPTMKGIITVTN